MAYLNKRFPAEYKQEEPVRRTLLPSRQTNIYSFIFCQELDLKLRFVVTPVFCSWIAILFMNVPH